MSRKEVCSMTSQQNDDAVAGNVSVNLPVKEEG
jgi:hypothetical protein